QQLQETKEVSDMDTDDEPLVEDGELIEEDWLTVDTHRQRTPALRVALSDLLGGSRDMKRQELDNIVHRQGASIVSHPVFFRLGAKEFFKVQPLTDEDSMRLLDIVIDASLGATAVVPLDVQGSRVAGAQESRRLFMKMNEIQERAQVLQRSVVLYGLCPIQD